MNMVRAAFIRSGNGLSIHTTKYEQAPLGGAYQLEKIKMGAAGQNDNFDDLLSKLR